MTRVFTATAVATCVAVALVSAASKFTAVWKSPDAGAVSFAGKKVAALGAVERNTIVKEAVKELQKQGLARTLPK